MKYCFLMPPVRVAIVYIHVPHDMPHIAMAERFAYSYFSNPPNYPHDTLVICNGSPANANTGRILGAMPGIRFINHDDTGWDIGGYQKAAEVTGYDMMVFLGGSSRFAKPGWMERMVESFMKYDGKGLFGAMGNKGVPHANVYPHIRTTGFWMDPGILRKYPLRVTQPSQRYLFEHGKDCLTSFVKSKGMKALVVSWDGEYEWQYWDSIPNGYHRGNQSNLLVRDRLCEPPYFMS